MPRKPPAPSPRAHIAHRLVSSRGPLNRLKARRYGLDTLLGRPPTLELYYEPGDPHSHLAAQLLPALQRRLNIPLAVRVVGEPEPVLYPEADKQRGFALTDAIRIAPSWGLEFPEDARLPDAKQRFAAAQILLAAADDIDAFAALEAEVAAALFRGLVERSEADGLTPEAASAALTANNQRRAHLGHYLPGMWQFNGDWFWGVDRLNYLEAALRAGGHLDGNEPLAGFDASRARLPALRPDGDALEFFFSFRSPYSYLAAEALKDWLPELPTSLWVRPVLPMAMRGMKIPRRKSLYIARDVKREADWLGLPFGLIADPLGAGAQRCLTLFPLAEGSEQQMAYLVSAARAIWTQGIDVATDAGLQFAWERAGQAWPPAAEKLANGMDLDYAEVNREALFAEGLWGVPSFRCGEFVTWGRDRIWMLEEVFRRGREPAA